MQMQQAFTALSHLRGTFCGSKKKTASCKLTTCLNAGSHRIPWRYLCKRRNVPLAVWLQHRSQSPHCMAVSLQILQRLLGSLVGSPQRWQVIYTPTSCSVHEIRNRYCSWLLLLCKASNNPSPSRTNVPIDSSAPPQKNLGLGPT